MDAIPNRTGLTKLVSFLFLVFMTIYVIRQYTKRGCSYLPPPTINGISKSDKRYDYLLRDFYIKSSYNSCASGEFKNDWVNVCALAKTIKQGCRVLDFEVYDLNGTAIVGVSSTKKYSEKGSYNYIPLDNVIQLISETAISNSMSTKDCPNSNDPLILHFRMKTKHVEIYDALADSIVTHLDGWLLPNEYSYENNGQNLGASKIKNLLGKVIIAVDNNDSSIIQQSKLNELINILGNSAFLRSLQYNDVAYTPDMDELTAFNKKNLCFTYPNISYKSDNYNSSVTMQYGVQMSAMCFQTNDSYLQAYTILFNKAGCAFILKPESLRYKIVEVSDPPKDPSVSTAPVTYQKDNLYKFSI